MNEEYATQIARDWNARDGHSGYVTRFQVRKAFLDRYEVHQVGAAVHLEYWIPARIWRSLIASLLVQSR
ncbi:hypothetical protein [Dictyobacter kobayashii]|uniref:hypothetical protein n=1 Tax=Dictyobacter kobayashii TaxID=2014872 RepID=UPI001C3FB396|nr:hypothetical protein [Dictyobacter kobayashii]